MSRRKFTYTYSPRAGRADKAVYTRIPRERGRTWLRRERREGRHAPRWLPLIVVAATILGLAFIAVRFAGTGPSAPESNQGPALAGIEGTQERPQAPYIRSSRGPDGGGYSYNGDLKPPTIGAQAAAVIEAPCGAVLHEQNAHTRLPPAS